MLLSQSPSTNPGKNIGDNRLDAMETETDLIWAVTSAVIYLILISHLNAEWRKVPLHQK